MSASGELMACGDFMVLLRAVLTLGNHLNEGTQRGAASGERHVCPHPELLRSVWK